MKKLKSFYLSIVAAICSLGLIFSASAISFAVYKKSDLNSYKVIDGTDDASQVVEEQTKGNNNSQETSKNELIWAASLLTESGKTVTITGVKVGNNQTLIIPSSIQGYAVTTINSLVLSGGLSLKKLVIPASVIDIKAGALKGHGALKEISVDSANTVYANVNGNLCTKSGDLVMFAGGNTTSTTYEVPAGTSSIMKDAFTGSSITTLTGATDAIMSYYYTSDYSDAENTGNIASADFGKTIYLKWKLLTPTVTANADTKTASWQAVPHATSYIVKQGTSASALTDFATTTETSASLSSLASGTYYLAVIAKGAGYTDSAVSSAVEYIAKAGTITITFTSVEQSTNANWGVIDMKVNGEWKLKNAYSIEIEAGLTLAQILAKLNATLAISNSSETITASNFSSRFKSTYWNQGADLNKVFNENTNIVFYYGTCFTADTDVLCYDEKKKKFYKKKIKDITYSDLVACWDFDNGKLTYSKVIWIRKPESKQCLIRELTFTGGTKLTIVDEHMMFAANKGKFVTDFEVGDQFMNEKGEYITLTKIEESYRTEVPYAIATNYHINCFTGGVVGSLGYNNLYPIKDRKFVKDDRKIVPFEELKVPREYYDGFRLGEVANRTPERINSSINNYFVKNMLPKE